MTGNSFDIVIIGSGPGGYIAAIRAAQLGFRVACVEKDSTYGGTCLNVGCIPSKAMLESSYLYHKMQNQMGEHGVGFSEIQLNLTKLLQRKDEVVKRLTSGVAGLIKKNKITGVRGMARLQSATQIEVTTPEGGTEILTAKNIIIATGSVPSGFPGVEVNEEVVVSSTGALTFHKVPEKLLVIGGGYIGLELGSVWGRLGSKVTVIEFMDRIIPNMDGALSKRMLKILKDQGIEFRLKTAVKEVEVKGDVAKVTIENNGTTEVLEADRVLVSIGRKPMTEGLGLEHAGVKLNAKGFIEVNKNFETSVKGVYAIGDVIGGLMLAHKAEEEGVCCVEIIAGEKPEVNYNLVPGILYTHPEVAAVGKTEEELKKEGVPFNTGMFRLMANGRAISVGETEGFVKILAHKQTDEILGAHIIAPNASEMIHEFCVAMEFSATAEDIAMTMHGHPTVSEAIKEAALDCHGRVLNS